MNKLILLSCLLLTAIGCNSNPKTVIVGCDWPPATTTKIVLINMSAVKSISRESGETKICFVAGGVAYVRENIEFFNGKTGIVSCNEVIW